MAKIIRVQERTNSTNGNKFTSVTIAGTPEVVLSATRKMSMRTPTINVPMNLLPEEVRSAGLSEGSDYPGNVIFTTVKEYGFKDREGVDRKSTRGLAYVTVDGVVLHREMANTTVDAKGKLEPAKA